MSVVSVAELPAAREGSFERNQGRLERRYSRTFRVISDDAADDAATILVAGGLPLIGAAYPSDAFSRLQTKQASETQPGERPIWEVRCEYSSNFEEYPWYPYTPAQISYSWDRREIPITEDRDGEPILNSAGDGYDPPVMMEQPLPAKSISVNLLDSDFSPSWLAQFYLAVNSSSYDGWAKGQALVTDISASQQFYTDENGTEYTYWQVAIKITFNGDANGWQPVVLNQGMRELVDGEKKNIVIKGREITSPCPLDENGRALTGDDAADNAVYSPYKVYRETSFSQLNF